MKIVDVKTHVVSTAWRNLNFLRVLTDEGIERMGEVRMSNHTDALLHDDNWYRRQATVGG